MAPSQNQITLEALANELSQLSNAEDKIAAINARLQSAQSGSAPVYLPGLQAEGGNPSDPLNLSYREGDEVDQLVALLKKHGLTEAWSKSNPTVQSLDRVSVLKRLPCAHIQPENRWGCPKEGKLACSRCKLVGYCSKVGILIWIASSFL